MSKAVIGQFYETEKAAEARARELVKEWDGKLAWYVVGGDKGYLVISEKAAKAVFKDRIKAIK